MKRVTLDSNFYLSALVFGGKPKRILEMGIEGEIEVAVSDPIIEEVQRHLLGKFGWSEARAAEAIESIREFTTHVTPTEIIDAVPTVPIRRAVRTTHGRRESGAHAWAMSRRNDGPNGSHDAKLAWRERPPGTGRRAVFVALEGGRSRHDCLCGGD